MAARKQKTYPIEVQARAGLPLGMAPATFLRDYWQKRPLLIRAAFPDFETPVLPEDLAGLACEEGALARIVSHDRATDGWELRTGPFQEEDFPGMPDHDWTLLVQDVDKWDPEVRALTSYFNFLPRWRMDDVMISFAATGGSVGAHVDQYDVFLLQAHGQRRWQIDASESTKGKRPSLEFRPDVELKLLKKFKATHDWVLGPGDMLYLPPNVPHNGVAVNPCLTFSFGMRAPSSAELISDYLDDLVADADESIRFQDPDLKLPEDPNEIDAAAMKRVVAALNALRMNDPDRLGNWFGRFITTYRAAGDILPSQAPPSPEEVTAELENGGVLERHPWARLAWRRATRGASLYCSGLAFQLSIKDAQTLAGAEQIDIALFNKLGNKGRDALMELITGGHYQLLDVETIAAMLAEQDALEVLEDAEQDFDDEEFDDEADAPEVEIEVIEYSEAGDGEPSSASIETVLVSEEGVEVVVICDDGDEEDEDDAETPSA
ncbi:MULTISPECIES: cupin domain-containing protein [Stenotrophomonas]|uniref:ribosomal protein uL16 3-hydroxylase n=1 Tax=Stenotrophomonas TaxID=40323 RepID=UPI0007700DB4|nr:MULTISPECIES: cupin domain-containing protein [Stenotrophomonas]AMJ55453.1 transcriptional regulator [Stenotrophomonas sp. KCTC 12332]